MLHLYLGTQSDNVKDSVRDGTHHFSHYRYVGKGRTTRVPWDQAAVPQKSARITEPISMSEALRAHLHDMASRRKRG
jgi:hypothetical protein